MLAQAAVTKYCVDLEASHDLDSGKSETRALVWLALLRALCASLGKLKDARGSSPLGSTGSAPISWLCLGQRGSPVPGLELLMLVGAGDPSHSLTPLPLDSGGNMATAWWDSFCDPLGSKETTLPPNPLSYYQCRTFENMDTRIELLGSVHSCRLCPCYQKAIFNKSCTYE